MIDFFPLNSKDEDSINAALYHADTILQVKKGLKLVLWQSRTKRRILQRTRRDGEDECGW